MRAALRWLCMLGAVSAVLGPPTQAAAQDTGWVIEAFAVDITVESDGTMRVTEDIAVDFASLQRHGIYRVIPVRYALAPGTEVDLPAGVETSDVLRVIDVTDIRVESTAPNALKITRPGPLGGHDLTLRIGDEDRTVTGRHRYLISYRVRGALNSFEAHDELYWNATGHGWPVPIEHAAVTVRGTGLNRAGCYRGTPGSTNLCDAVSIDGQQARTTTGLLAPGEGVTVVAEFAPGALSVSPPILVERWTLWRALTGHPLAFPLTVLAALLGFGGVGMLLYREGRDRVTRGPVAVDGHLDRQVTRRPLFSGRDVTVAFRPPDGLRPGQIGVLVDERVDPVDVSATVVDLAVRGHLVIEESKKRRLWSTRYDWTVRATDADRSSLLDYERTLLRELFKARSEVTLSDLKGTFAESYGKVRRLMAEDAVTRGWFARDPHSTRTIWLAIGIAATVAAVGILVVAALFTTVALAAVPFVLAGAVLTAGHQWMPHRTAHGSRMLTETLGFREFIVTAETSRMEFAEAENLFMTYLPYAVVFGAVEKWARAFAHLGAAATAGVATWYVGSGMDGSGGLTRLSSGLSEFSSHIASTLPTAPASSGSSSGGGGSSGGGFGGGGGGSW